MMEAEAVGATTTALMATATVGGAWDREATAIVVQSLTAATVTIVGERMAQDDVATEKVALEWGCKAKEEVERAARAVEGSRGEDEARVTKAARQAKAAAVEVAAKVMVVADRKATAAAEVAVAMEVGRGWHRRRGSQGRNMSCTPDKFHGSVMRTRCT